MEPQYTDYLDSLGLALYVLKDIGWTVFPPSASNNAPVLTAVGAQSTDEDTAKTITLAATDADGDSLTYSVTSACATNITCAISGTSLTMTPAANFHGSGSITVSVSDGNGGSDSDTFTLTVNSVNDAPVFSAVGAQSTNEDTAKTITLAASDVDGDSLTYSVTPTCATNITCAISGTSLTMTPAANFNGSGAITVGVSDGNGGSDSDTFTLTVNSVNDAPVFTAVGAQNTNEDTAKTITLAASDADGDSLTYSVTSACATSITCAISGTSLTMTPAANFHGSGSITVSVSDGNGGSDSATFTLTVTSVNDAPVLTNPGTRSMNTNDSLTIALAGYASDVDGDSLTFSAACSGLSCVVSGTNLDLSTDGSFSGGSVTLSVTDTASSASQTFAVNLGNSYSLEVTHNGNPLTSGTLIGLLDYSFSLGNDHGQYSVSAYLNSQDVSSLISVAGSVYSLNMPSSGTFAGPYDVVIYDGDTGITTHLELIRPPRISLNHSALLSGESHYQLDIEGAAPATDFDLSSSDSSVSFEDELGNPLSFSTASSNAASFHRASAWLVVSSNVQSSTTLTASASAYEDVSINDVPVYPAINYSLHLQNNQGDPLPGSLILNDSNLLTDLGIGLDADTSSGDLSLNLPAGTTVTGTASATNYTDTDFTLDGSNVDVTITLADNAVPVTISGTISGNGGLDFEQEAPQVSIKLSNNQTLSLTVNVDSATQASFSKQLDLNSQSPSLLTISHSQSATATLGLGNVSTDKHFTVNMVKVSSSTSVTVVTSTNIGTKKGGAVLSYLLLCALPLMWRRRKNQQY